MRRTYLHVAGTPCKDFSTQNNSRPGLGGKTTRHLLIWVALMRLVLPQIIICENVPSFPPRILVKYLPMYSIDTVVLSNLGFGHCIERRRRYTTLHLRTEVRLVRELASIEPCLGRDKDPESHTWPQYLVAQEGELSQELGWANARFPGAAPSTMSDDDAFYKALNHWERDHLNKAKAKAPAQCYTLSQDPDKRKCWSSSDHIHTLIANTHMLWAEPVRRWFTARETLSLQGFPVHPCHLAYLNNSTGLCSFNYSRIGNGLRARSRRAMVQQAGDSMHVSVVTAAVLWVGAYTEPVAAATLQLLPRANSSSDSDDKSSQTNSASASFCAALNMLSQHRGSSTSATAIGSSRLAQPATGSGSAGPSTTTSACTVFSNALVALDAHKRRRLR